MKPSLLNAPFNEREYRQRMDDTIRAKHGFKISVDNSAPNTVATPSTQTFCKWPAYITYWGNNQLGFNHGGNLPAVGRQAEDGSYVYLLYNGGTMPFTTGSLCAEITHHDRFLICPELVALILKHGEPITDQDTLDALLKKFPPIPYDEWIKLPVTYWPASVML